MRRILTRMENTNGPITDQCDIVYTRMYNLFSVQVVI